MIGGRRSGIVTNTRESGNFQCPLVIESPLLVLGNPLGPSARTRLKFIVVKNWFLNPCFFMYQYK